MCIARPQQVLGCLVLIVFQACIDPVEPNFQFREGLIFIEGFATSSPGASFVSISESVVEFGVEGVNFVGGATVTLMEESNGRQVLFEEVRDAYFPPADFAVNPGESWLLDIRLADGTHYQSTYEDVANPVPVRQLQAAYKPQLFYREASERYIPGHEITVDLTDPAGIDNYYYYRYRVFENLDECEKCFFGVYRDGSCRGAPPGTILEDYYDYRCTSDCWQIRYPEQISIFDDRFINGQEVRSLAVANIPLYTREDMVVEIQQLSLTPKAFDYYKVLKDLVDNNSGFNAPPPAALIGNITNQEVAEDIVFGRFTAAATSLAYIFVDRSGIEEETVDRPTRTIRENCEVCPPGSPCPIECAPVNTSDCSETRYRTSMMPPAWIEQ